MRTINKIIYHCSANQATADIGVKEIREYHINGRGWKDIGYHYVIRRNGTIENGRDEYVAGAHCLNQNAHSIGICLVGGLGKNGNPESNFTKEQFNSLEELTRKLIKKYPDVKIYGHNEFANKACPVFDVREFLKERGLIDYKG